MNQISMCAMKLNRIKTSFHSTSYSTPEFLNHSFYFVRCERSWLLGILIKGDRGRSYWNFSIFCFAARMSNLNANLGTITVTRIYDPLQSWDLFI